MLNSSPTFLSSLSPFNTQLQTLSREVQYLLTYTSKLLCVWAIKQLELKLVQGYSLFFTKEPFLPDLESVLNNT